MKSKIIFASVLFVSMAILLGGVASGAEQIALLKVSAPNVNCVDVPVHAVIELSEQRLASVLLGEVSVELRQFSNMWNNVSTPGQIVMNDRKQAELWWVLPEAKANSTSTWTVGLIDRRRPEAVLSPVKVFSWRDQKGDYLDLLFNGRKVTRYIYAYDTSTAQRILDLQNLPPRFRRSGTKPSDQWAGWPGSVSDQSAHLSAPSRDIHRLEQVGVRRGKI